MDINKNIADILQLYEFSMAIGKSLDYKKNCDNFLTLLLARKNLSGCCILKKNTENHEKQYSFPSQEGAEYIIPEHDFLSYCYRDQKPKTGLFNVEMKTYIPFCTDKGSWLFFSLKEDLGLFLFKNNGALFTTIEINQLEPIINKFSTSIDACHSYAKQENLLTKLTIQNQELKEYSHVISHDLKSPLRNINTAIAWTKEDVTDLNSTVIKNLEIIDDNVEKMDNLINGLLTYSTIDKKDSTIKQVHLESFIQEIIKKINPEKHITFSTKTNISSLNIDPFHLEQLLCNLIKNAVEHIDKKEGKVHITIMQQGPLLNCSIEDNGKGIPERYHKKIFEIFQTLDASSRSIGVGLSIVKKIVELYDGNIWLESEEGNGTVFHFTLKK